MNKAESLDDGLGSLAAASGEALRLGFGDLIALSAETGQGMVELYEALRPLLEDYMVQLLNDFPQSSSYYVLFSIKLRTIILRRGLVDRSIAVVEQCLALIKDEWLMKSCSRDPIVLLRYLDVETYELVGEFVMEAILNINIGESIP
ncbi:hypothetical protein POM88_014017 [Heracleum sosnowskyi]|uniref:Uncharacterized protein n=1 Tax=Heracleum sosnowskyi TaxID=360622 RepID=A0AAD8J281_9APIA|nr:hypothetical protein POM88_014017 [Heracleum sosnowskyi]